MKKMHNYLMALKGIIIFFFVLIFYSCDTGNTEGGSAIVADTVEVEQERDTINWEKRIDEETAAMEARYDSLKVKAKKRGKQVEEEVDQVIESLNKERKEISEGNTSEKIEAKWEKFKEKSEAVIDSLDKRI